MDNSLYYALGGGDPALREAPFLSGLPRHVTRAHTATPALGQRLYDI